MSYRLKQKGELDVAISLFNILLERYPSSYRAYYFRGETYREKGEVEKAIESYSKALEINPDFSAAKKKLDELKDR